MNRSLRLYIASVSLTFWGGLLLAYLTGNVHAVSHPRAVAPLFGIAVAAEALVVYRRKETGKDTFSFSATARGCETAWTLPVRYASSSPPQKVRLTEAM